MTSGSSLPGSADDGSDVQENLDDLINEIGPGIAEDSSDESRQSKGCTGSESGIERARKVTEQATSASAWATLRNLHAACRRYMDVRTTDTIEGKKPSWALGNIKDSVLAPVSNSKKDPNAAWSLRVSILGAKDMPKLDMWGLADPYACISLFLVEDGFFNGADYVSCLDHNVSKSNRKEHITTRNGKPTRMVNPMRRTKVINQSLEPAWRQVFHFDGVRNAKMGADGLLQVEDAEVGNMAGKLLVALVTVHDHDYLQADDFGGRCVIPVTPGLSDRVWVPLVNNDKSKVFGKSGKQTHVALQFDYSVDLLLKKPAMTKHYDEGKNHRFQFCAASMQGWRTTMEDAHVGILGFGDRHDAFFGVFDGHGGQDVAKFAANNIPKKLLADPAFSKGNFEVALVNSCAETDCMLLSEEGRLECGGYRGDVGREAYYMPASGTTACMCFIHGVDLYCANLGDSRAVIGAVAGDWPMAVPLSEDHKPSDDLEVKRIKEAGGYVKDGRIEGVLAVSRAIGDLEFKNNDSLPLISQIVSSCPDVKKYTLKKSDKFILIACDGIWDVFSSQEAVQRVHKYLKTMDTKQAVTALLDSACSQHPSKNNGLGTDNMTAIIIDLFPNKSALSPGSA